MNLEDFVGRSMLLYGADNNRFRVRFESEGMRTFEAIEDPEDGYRSSLERLDEGDKPNDVFPGAAVACVTGRRRDKSDDRGLGTGSAADVLELVDGDGHVWLEVGTEDIDDYYPGFCFHFHPKAPAG